MSKWKEKLQEQKQNDTEKQIKPTAKRERPLESFNRPQPPPASEVPDYIQKEMDEGLPIPARPAESIFDFAFPETAWLSSDKLRVISYLVFQKTSRQQINEITQDLAKVFLVVTPPDNAKRLAQAFLTFLEQKEAEKQKILHSIFP